MGRRKDPTATDGLPLTDQQRMFCREYAIDLNGTQAAIRAGYSPKTANEQAARLLAKASVQEMVARVIEKRSIRVEVDAAWVLNRLIRVNDRCIDDDTFDATGANKSAELIGKHLRMFVDRHEVVDVQSAKQFASDVLGIVIRRVQDPKVREAIVADIEALCRA